MKQARIRKLKIAREHPWHEVLPTDPRDPMWSGPRRSPVPGTPVAK